MKKFASLLMAVLMLCTMIPFAAIPASAEGNTTVMAEAGTCHVEMKKEVNTYIEFTPSSEGNYTFISNATKVSTGYPQLTANLYYKTRRIASDSAFSAGNGNFCITYLLEAGKTYKLEIQLKNFASCSADISVLKEVTPESICEISGNCIISKQGSYTCERFIVNNNSTLIIGRNATINVKQGLVNRGKIELLGKLDLSQVSAFMSGDISIGEYGSLVEPASMQGKVFEVADVPQGKSVPYDGTIQEVVRRGKGYTITGHYAKNVGNYEATAQLDDGYIWSDGTLEVKKISWSIYNPFVKVPPYAHLHYTGEELTVFEDTDKYTVINGKRTDTGSYYAILKLKDPDKYKWESTDRSDKSEVEAPFEIHQYCDIDGNGSCDNCSGYIFNIDYLNKKINADSSVSTEEKTCDGATVVLSDDTVWGVDGESTWLVVDYSVDLENRPVVKGDVHLILKDNTTLTAKNGIRLAEGNTLSVYAQSDGEAQGKLAANGGGGNAAIGGNKGRDGSGNSTTATNGENCGKLNVYGGIITANGNGATGIGGGIGGNGMNGKSYAASGGYQEGVYKNGANGGNGGEINLYSGIVTATGAIGIGGGIGGNGGYGDIFSYDGYNQNCVGGNGGNGGGGSLISVYGGKLNATGDKIGIGGGNGGNGGGYYPYNNYGEKTIKYVGVSEGGNGGNGGKLTVKGGTVMLNGGVKAAGGGNGGNGVGKTIYGKTGGNTDFDLAEGCTLKAGSSAESAAILNAVTDYTNQPHLSVQYNTVSALGSILSNGSIWIIAAVAVVALGGTAVPVIAKKKKKGL